MSKTQDDLVSTLLDEHGTTYAAAAGITLRDKPSPLFQLLVLTMLSSAPVSGDVAATTASELSAAGWRTPQKMRAATWQQRVDVLRRGGYRRYDESTATKLEEASVWLLETHDGDLRHLRPGEDGSVDDLLAAIAETPSIGPVGAKIFCREVQGVWPEVAPYFDDRALSGARKAGLPSDVAKLADLAPRGEVARFAAALVRADMAG